MKKLLLAQTLVIFFISVFISFSSFFLSSVQAISILNNSKQDETKQSETKLPLTLELTRVGDLELAPGMIFIETKESKPAFSGTAAENSSVVIDLGNKTETVKSNSKGSWEWTPSEDLLNGESELKITSGNDSKTYRLKVTATSVPASGLNSPGPTTSPVTTPLPNIQADTETKEEGPLNSLQGYLPFIIGGLAVGILLFLISWLLKPKNTVLSEIETPTPPPSIPVSNPSPPNTETPPSTTPWNLPPANTANTVPISPTQPETPSETVFTPETPAPPSPPVNTTPNVSSENPPVTPNQASPSLDQSGVSSTNPTPTISDNTTKQG